MTRFDRRLMLAGLGAGTLAAWLGGCSESAADLPDQTFFERVGRPMGLQVYALGDEIRADLGAAFTAIAAMGYGEIELPSLLGSSAPELRRLADAAGLAIGGLHIPARAFAPSDGLTFEDEPDAIAEIMQALGSDDVVIPFPLVPEGFAPGEGEDFPTAISRTFSALGLDHWRDTAARFNAIGTAMQQRGLRTSYHNHNLEFAPLEGTTPFEVLMQETDPDVLKVELDIGWAVTAGQDPLALLQALTGRVHSLHVKDVAADNRQGYYFGMSPAEVGSGTVDWKAVLPAAALAGCGHYFVEQEPPFTIPREEAAKKSADFLKVLIA